MISPGQSWLHHLTVSCYFLDGCVVVGGCELSLGFSTGQDSADLFDTMDKDGSLLIHMEKKSCEAGMDQEGTVAPAGNVQSADQPLDDFQGLSKEYILLLLVLLDFFALAQHNLMIVCRS